MTYGFFLTDETASMCSETYDIAPLSLRNHTRRSTARPLHIPAFTDVVASPLLMTPSLNREYADPSNNAGSILNNLEIEYEMDVGQVYERNHQALTFTGHENFGNSPYIHLEHFVIDDVSHFYG